MSSLSNRDPIIVHCRTSTLNPRRDPLGYLRKQVLDGVSYLLETGLQHDSLTPSNVLINEGGRVKIGMF